MNTYLIGWEAKLSKEDGSEKIGTLIEIQSNWAAGFLLHFL
jgi:hypothetical protein